MQQSPSEANNSLTGLQKSPSGYHRGAEILEPAVGRITVLCNIHSFSQSTWL